ncbi:MAG: TetR-like C-terminal domain-containing protein [Hyphomicrobiales bacterium]
MTKAVLAAAMAELAENGAGGLSVAAVAARSGVHATSIYRRWGNAARLGLEAALAAAEERLPVPDTGALRGDLMLFLGALDLHVRTPLGRSLLVLSELADVATAEARAAFWRERFGLARLMFTRAAARGEIARTTDADFALQFAIAPIYLRALVLQVPFEATYLARHVETVLQAFAPPAQIPGDADI